MTTTEKEFFAPLERKLEKELIKYLVQKQMFCKVTGDILDYRTCICIEVNDKDGKPIALSAVSPTLDLELDGVPKRMAALFPGAVVLFKTLNNKLINPLLTKIK